MKKDIDTLLKQALTPTQKPDIRLNQNILGQVKETKSMDKKKARRIPAAALAAVVALGAGSVTAYASWKYLAPDTITQSLHDGKLTNAFQSKDAVSINESQTMGGYRVTLLGIVSGKGISEWERRSNGNIIDDQTYCVTAIENADGTPMPDTSEDAYSDLAFCVSPLIKGYDPAEYNIFMMHGGYSEFVEDGVLYRLTECDNVEIFADHELYLCVSDGTFYKRAAYNYDEATGEISRNEDYDGLNVLFKLPIDASKADPEAAAEYLKSLKEEEENGADLEEGKILEDTKSQALLEMMDAWMAQITPENIDEYAVRVEDTVQILTPDSEGYLHFDYDVEGRSSGSGSFLEEWYFEDDEAGMSKHFGFSHSEDGLDSMTIETFTKNADGTVTFAIYIPKDSEKPVDKSQETR